MTSNLTSKQKEQLELGKKLQQFYELGYINKKQAILFSLYKGLAVGFGTIIGGTVILAVFLWVLGRFNQVPLLGHVVNAIRHTINSNKSIQR